MGITILQTIVSEFPLVVGLRTRLWDLYVEVVSGPLVTRYMPAASEPNDLIQLFAVLFPSIIKVHAAPTVNLELE